MSTTRIISTMDEWTRDRNWWRRKAPFTKGLNKMEWRAWNALLSGHYDVAGRYIRSWRWANKMQGGKAPDPFIAIEGLAARRLRLVGKDLPQTPLKEAKKP